MAVPSSGELSMNKIARERKGFGYDSSSNVTSPIFMSDISRLSGGNTSGSGTSYPAVNTLNPVNNRPDGSNPLSMGEFRGYEQNVSLTAFDFIFSNSSSNDACLSGIPSGPYYHNDGNNLFPDALNGTYTAFQNTSGSLVAPTGFYQVFTSGGSSSNKFIQVGSNGSIIGGGNC
tara:strand:- start:592 stop:1113 length:522 start_codon:yes stop_codon:yes gene_type:complete